MFQAIIQAHQQAQEHRTSVEVKPASEKISLGIQARSPIIELNLIDYNLTIWNQEEERTTADVDTNVCRSCSNRSSHSAD